jgi:hypothetical protein
MPQEEYEPATTASQLPQNHAYTEGTAPTIGVYSEYSN